MIKRIVFTKFKQFSNFDKELKPTGITVVAGGNNSGKSSLLHGLAVWEFAKLFIELEKGRRALYEGFVGEGVGISFDDFTPVNIPSLKYLWTNLTDLIGYKLKIKCYWDLPDKPDRYLEISYSLVSERLYMKNTASNVTSEDKIPIITYLPPFAGITDREQWYSNADRRKMLGRGLAGSILRNTIVDMHKANEELRKKMKGSQKKLPKADLEQIRKTNPYEILNSVLFEVFKIQLNPLNFNPNFHNYVRVELSKGEIKNKRFIPFKNFNKRDIMVEGSGFLQWLSVYTYALNSDVDVLLLDEPDAHLHTSLESVLFQKLQIIANEYSKQILMATHSNEIIKFSEPKDILHINRNNTKYLTTEGQKVGLIAGLGSDYSPLINKTQRHRKVLFTENDSDWKLIGAWFLALNVEVPQNLVVWSFANDHDPRKHLFIQMKNEFGELNAISLEDRDNLLYEETKNDLTEKGRPDWIEGKSCLRYRRWRRWEIENYLIQPAVIARTAKRDLKEVEEFIENEFGIKFPQNLTNTDRENYTRALFDIEGKIVVSKIENQFQITKFDIVKNFKIDEVFDDVKTLIFEIVNMCK